MQICISCGRGDKMPIVRNLRTFAYFNAKTNPETLVVEREKTQAKTESKSPQSPPNTSFEK